MAELVSVATVAKDLGVAPRTVHSWVQKYENFPDPVQETPLGRLYDLDEVRAWYAGWTPRPGRPPKAG